MGRPEIRFDVEAEGMKIPEFDRKDAIEIMWLDTVTPKHSGWFGKDEYAAFRDTVMLMRNVGMYLDHDDKYIRLCGCADMDDDEITIPMAIPLGCIQSIRGLK
jgi:hypothetical protein